MENTININIEKETTEQTPKTISKNKYGRVIGFQVYTPDEVDHIDEILLDLRIKKSIQRSLMFINESKNIQFLNTLTDELRKHKEIKNLIHPGLAFSEKKYNEQLCKKIFLSHYISYDRFCKILCTKFYKQLISENDFEYQKLLLSIDGLYKSEHKKIDEIVTDMCKKIDICIL